MISTKEEAKLHYMVNNTVNSTGHALNEVMPPLGSNTRLGLLKLGERANQSKISNRLVAETIDLNGNENFCGDVHREEQRYMCTLQSLDG